VIEEGGVIPIIIQGTVEGSAYALQWAIVAFSASDTSVLHSGIVPVDLANVTLATTVTNISIPSDFTFVGAAEIQAYVADRCPGLSMDDVFLAAKRRSIEFWSRTLLIERLGAMEVALYEERRRRQAIEGMLVEARECCQNACTHWQDTPARDDRDRGGDSARLNHHPPASLLSAPALPDDSALSGPPDMHGENHPPMSIQIDKKPMSCGLRDGTWSFTFFIDGALPSFSYRIFVQAGVQMQETTLAKNEDADPSSDRIQVRFEKLDRTSQHQRLVIGVFDEYPGLAPHERMVAMRDVLAPTRCDKPGTEKMFIVGLPKAGTTSLQHYFQCGNFSTSHFTCGEKICGECIRNNMLLRKKDPLEGCGSATVYAQMDVTFYPDDICYYPQIHALRELHDAYPDSVFLLNLRNVEEWVHSVQSWKTGKGPLALRLKRCFSLDGDSLAQDLRNFYLNHTQKIREFAEQFDHKLVEVHIDSGEASRVLELEFGIAATCWTQQNRGHYDQPPRLGMR